MAKLHARGRLEIVRYSKEKSIDLVAHPQSVTTWERRTVALMDDGRLLEKLDVRFKPDWLDPKGRFYSYGWKVKGKIKADKTLDEAKANLIAAWEKAGYTKC